MILWLIMILEILFNMQSKINLSTVVWIKELSCVLLNLLNVLFFSPVLQILLFIFKLWSSQNQSGLKGKELTSILAKIHSEQENYAKLHPDYWRTREDIGRTLEQRLQRQIRGSDPDPKSQTRSRQTVHGECKNHQSLLMFVIQNINYFKCFVLVF